MKTSTFSKFLPRHQRRPECPVQDSQASVLIRYLIISSPAEGALSLEAVHSCICCQEQQFKHLGPVALTAVSRKEFEELTQAERLVTVERVGPSAVCSQALQRCSCCSMMDPSLMSWILVLIHGFRGNRRASSTLLALLVDSGCCLIGSHKQLETSGCDLLVW